MKLKEIAVGILIVSLVGAAQPALAHEVRKVVDRAAVDRALARQVESENASRAAIRALLERDEVRRMAGDLGLEVRRAESAVATLQGAELQRVAQAAATANDQLTGGAQTIQISVVTLLLIIIIIILLAD
jgi:hypothetical protein